MSDFERAVLEILADRNEAVGWYKIEMLLTTKTFKQRDHLIRVLERMIASGWVRQLSHSSVPTTRYEITAEGREALG